MTFSRPGRLCTLVVCLLCSVPLFSQQQPQAQQQPPASQQQQPPVQQQPPATQPPKPQPPKANPFETVPQETNPPAAQPPKLEAPKPVTPTTAAGQPPEDVIETIEFRGNRRTPSDTLRTLVSTQKGDPFDQEALNRDYMHLWNTGRFDDLTMEKEAGQTGWIIRFVI